MSLLLVACSGDSADDRQFASDAEQTEEVGTITNVNIARATLAPAASPIAETLVPLDAVPGDAATLYATSGDLVIAVDATSGETNPIPLPPGERLLASAATGDGSIVAQLIETSSTLDLRILAADGKELRRVQLSQRASPVAGNPEASSDASPVASSPESSPEGTPDATPVAANRMGSLVAIAAADGQALVVHAGLGVVVVEPSGKLKTLLSPARSAGIVQIAWTLSGDAFAYLQEDSETRERTLFVARLKGVQIDPVAVVAPSDEFAGGPWAFAWMPDGRSLLVTRAPQEGILPGGDLFLVRRSGGELTYVVGASRFAPVAAIDQFVPSADGSHVAFTVIVPGESSPIVHSMWVVTLKGKATRPINVALNNPTGVTWTTSGLGWFDSASDGLVYYRADKNGDAVAVSTVIPAMLEASPEASPDAEASPSAIASPSS